MYIITIKILTLFAQLHLINNLIVRFFKGFVPTFSFRISHMGNTLYSILNILLRTMRKTTRNTISINNL